MPSAQRYHLKPMDPFLRTKRFKTISAFILGVVLFVASLSYYSSGIKPEVVHPDEGLRVRMAVYFKLFFMDRDLSDPRWQKREIYLGPPMSAYIVGLALWSGGQKDKIGETDIDNWWNFKESFAWNLSNIKLPSEEELYAVKFAMALFASLSCLAIYWICLKCFGIVTAIFSSLLFLVHPLMLACATRATLDAPLIFFVTLNILFMLFFYQNFSKGKFPASLFFAAIIGLNTAIASGIKIQGAIAGVIFLIFCFCIMAAEIIRHFNRDAGEGRDKISWTKKIRMIFASMALFSMMAMAGFILPNPCLYHKPVDGLKKMVELRVKQIDMQIKEFSTQNYFHEEYNTTLIRSFSEKMDHMALRMFSDDNKKDLFFLLRFLLFFYGLLLIFLDEIKHLRKNLFFSPNIVILLWFAVLFAAMAAIIYIDFATHYFTLIVPSVIFMAYAIDQILQRIFKFIVGEMKLVHRKAA